MSNKVEYKAFGTFRVTTYDDCDFRTIKNLGVYTGFIDDIAFALSDKSSYPLKFELVRKVDDLLDMTPKKKRVTIQLCVDSCTWNLGKQESLQYFKKLFKDREYIDVEPSSLFASVTLVSSKETLEEKREKALSKLTEEEKALLGLEYKLW